MIKVVYRNLDFNKEKVKTFYFDDRTPRKHIDDSIFYKCHRHHGNYMNEHGRYILTFYKTNREDDAYLLAKRNKKLNALKKKIEEYEISIETGKYPFLSTYTEELIGEETYGRWAHR